MGMALLTFEWSWGDGTFDDTHSQPTTSHAYQRAGTFNVLLTVRDSEGGEDSVGLQLEVLHNVTIHIDEVGTVTDPGEHHNNTYITLTVTNAAPFPVDLPPLEPVLYDSSGNMAEHNGTVGTFFSRLDVDGSMVLTLYFVYAPTSVPEEFNPTRMVLLGWELDWEIVLYG
jgi:PKD repeat protein